MPSVWPTILSTWVKPLKNTLDENDKPTPVPRLDLQSEEQKTEWKRAEIRRKMRMKLIEEIEESKVKKVTLM